MHKCAQLDERMRDVEQISAQLAAVNAALNSLEASFDQTQH